MTPTSTDRNERIALFPGSFRPFTRGHADIVGRGLEIFDKVIVAVGINTAKPHADTLKTVEDIRRLYASNPRVDVCAYSCLTVELARKTGARFILRGVRSVKDFEYERDLADINRQLSGIESVILFSRPELAAISSSIVRELQSYGIDTNQFLPPQPE